MISGTSLKCKNCESINVIKWGNYKGVQRYKCKDCNRKFKADDALFAMKTPAPQVSASLNMYYEGMSIAAIRRNLKQQFGNMPSTATIYEWVQKYTQYAKDSIKEYPPKNIGDTWIADETVLRLDGQNVWMFDIIDEKTRYLLATVFSVRRTTKDAQTMMDRAIKTAGKEPKKVITDKLRQYIDVYYGKDAEHVRSGIARADDSTQKIERFHSTLKSRTKVMRGLKNIESALEFIDGWLVHYNYLRPHSSLNDKTPAEAAGVDFPYKNWADVTRHKPSKPITTSHVKRGTMRLGDTRVGRPRKRTRVKYPKLTTMASGSIEINRGTRRGHIKL